MKMRLAGVACLLVGISACVGNRDMAEFRAAFSSVDLLLRGNVVTPDGVIANGWIAVVEGKIVSITKEKPTLDSTATVVTDDLVFPGFVDLHNHPMYNVFSRWTPPKQFNNRYEWRTDPAYAAAMQNPMKELLQVGLFCDIDLFVEVRALIAGTTTFSGISKPNKNEPIPTCVKGLVRNVDWFTGFYGNEAGHERAVNALGVAPNDLPDERAAELRKQLKGGELDLIAIHLAEGRSDDAVSKGEFALLKRHELLTDRTVVIHAVALTEPDFVELASSNAGMVWSPRSNLELYKETANIAAARRAGVAIAIAPDWAPTGSDSMLDELRYIARLNWAETAFSPDELFRMATAVPAKLAGMGDKLGQLKQGFRADFFLIKGDALKPFDSLLRANPSNIKLVVINGVPTYGDSEALRAAGGQRLEAIDVCGKAKALNSEALGGKEWSKVHGGLKEALKGKPLGLAELANCG